MSIISTFDSSQALREGILRDSNKSDTQILPYNDLVTEFQECVKVWDTSGNYEKLKSMFGEVCNKVKPEQCVCLGLAGFSKRTLVSVKGGHARIINPLMHLLVCLSKLLPMFAVCRPIGLRSVHFHDPKFTNDEKKLLQELPFKYVEYVSIVDARRALDKRGSFTFLIAINLQDLIYYQIDADFPGLYMGTKMDTLIQGKEGEVGGKKKTFEEFKDRSKAIEIQNLNDEAWTTSATNEIRYLTVNRYGRNL